VDVGKVVFEIRPGHTRRKRAPKIYKPWMLKYLVPEFDGEPRDHNQAAMDLPARVCVR
jgi:adenine-specific DNA glycosylase